MEKTIREMIRSYQSEVKSGNLMPVRASEILTEISALLGNINEEILKTDVAYNKILLEAYNTQETANRAKIIANTSPEYEAMRTAKNIEKESIELIRSIKYFLRVQEDEYRQMSI